jgi:hypothetical protein
MLLLPLFFACSPTLQIDYKVEEYLWLLLASLGRLDTCKSSFLKVFSAADWNASFGSILLTVHTNNHARYFATFCITSGTYTSIGVIIAWCMSQLIGSVTSLIFSPLSCTQSWIRDEESDWHSYVHGYRAVRECPRIAYLPKA